MAQFIAPQVLRVNGKTAPCECTENIVCAYCVQANLILWERKEEKSPIIALRDRVGKRGIRAIAREFEVDHKTITAWIHKGIVPEKYIKNGELVGNCVS